MEICGTLPSRSFDLREVFMKRYSVGIVGATGMVGQRFVTLLENHPMFEPVCLAASKRSAGMSYAEAVGERWAMASPIPAYAKNMTVCDSDPAQFPKVDFVFCAVNLAKDATRALEEDFARHEIPVVSNNSANRQMPDVPMVIPEINPEHLAVIDAQRRRLGTRRGFIAVKSNCSLQSYVPLLHPLRKFGLEAVSVCTYQAISGAGKTFASMPEIIDNVIPYISGEEEKSEREPLKIWGTVENGGIREAQAPRISAQCLRVPVSDGHTAAVSVKFHNKPTREDILAAWDSFAGEPQALGLPTAPKKFLHYLEDCDRPQPKLDRLTDMGMAVLAGRLREDPVFDWKFIGFSHNTLRGAAGGAVLLAELLAAKGYFD